MGWGEWRRGRGMGGGFLGGGVCFLKKGRLGLRGGGVWKCEVFLC